MLDEVLIVLHVEGGEGQFVDEAAGGDPGVVLRARAAAAARVSRDIAPGADNIVVGWQGGVNGQPGLEFGPPVRTPLPYGRPRASSPSVTKVMPASAPMSARRICGGSRFLILSEAMSVSRTTRCTGFKRRRSGA